MQITANVTHSVQFSRTQGIWSATALGGSVVIGVGIFVTGTHFLQMSGANSPFVYGIGALLFLPIIFSCVQRSSGAASSAGFYFAARASGSALRLFFTIWLMLGGYLTLGALLAYGAATRLDLGLERIFNLRIGVDVITILMIASAYTKDVSFRAENWRTRTAVFWSCVFFLLILVTLGFISQSRTGKQIPKTEPLQHTLIAVSMFASSLWGIEILLNYRGQFRLPNRTLTWSLIIIFCGGSLLAALISIAILRNPSLMMGNWTTALSWNETRLELLILVAGFLICYSGMLRVITRITRVIGMMLVDGALPSPASENHTTIQRYFSALFCALLVVATVSLALNDLLMLSGFAVLLSLVIFLQPMLKKDVSRMVQFSLPFHPLIPGLSIVVSIFLMWILPIQDLLIAGIWMIAGIAFYFVYARTRMLPGMQKEQMLSGEKIRSSIPAYRVLVCLNDEEINSSLISIASSLAAANDGEVLVLRVLETSELTPSHLQRTRGEEEWERMRDELQKFPLPGPAPTPVVRMAPDAMSGIKATSREFDVDFIFVEWPEDTAERTRKNQLQSLLQLTSKPLGILRGQFDHPQKISVGCGDTDRTILALQLGEAISSGLQSRMEALKIFTKSESDEIAKNEAHSAIQKAGMKIVPEILLLEERDVTGGILKLAKDSDLLLMGASSDPLSGRLLPDGPVMEIAAQRVKATLIIKDQEESSQFFLRRIIAQVTQRVSPITTKERAELLGQLKVGLQARSDFYLMVALAAGIAITGLIMNDGSIVLGAMLVSPLMSPIVGIACGIALGNLDLIRRSGASTFKGMALVLCVGIVMTFLLPSVEPTEQILSRTHPGIFDLLAALAAGAAGAYSLSRKSVAGALPGVAMSLSLEPPLATAGYGLATSEFWMAGGAFLLFLTNLAAIVLSGVGIYLLLGMRPPKKEGLFIVGKSVASVILVTFVLMIPLGFGTYRSVQRGHLKAQIESQFRDEAIRERFELLELEISELDNGFSIHPTVLAAEEVTPEKIEKFRKAVEKKAGLPIQIDATILQTKRIESPEVKK